jgi:Double zinc ribbon
MPSSRTPLRFRLCLECARAVPVHSGELFCVNDGSKLIEACPRCGSGITSPEARFCPSCGFEYRSRPAAPPATSSGNDEIG